MNRRTAVSVPIFLRFSALLLLAYQQTSASDCSSVGITYQSASNLDGSLSSPRYPLNYPPSTTCLWSIRRPRSSYAVRLTFRLFRLESTSSCEDDYVEIRDGDLYSSSKLIGRFCGSRLPPVITSSYKFLFVKFVSDYDYSPLAGQFQAYYRGIIPARTAGKCSSTSPFLHNNDLQLSGSSGTFQSPSYPFYPKNMICTWKITVPQDRRVQLTFDYFSLKSGLCSNNDYVMVRDGSSSTSLLKGTYCGTTTPSSITSSGRYLWVRFRSDADSGRAGFKARFRAVSAITGGSSGSTVVTVIGVLVAIGVVIIIIVIGIALVKRKNRRVVAARTQAITATTTTTVTATHPPPVGYTQTSTQQYPHAPGTPHPRGYQSGPSGLPPPPPNFQPGPPAASPGVMMNPAYNTNAYPPHNEPPSYQQQPDMNLGPTTVAV